MKALRIQHDNRPSGRQAVAERPRCRSCCPSAIRPIKLAILTCVLLIVLAGCRANKSASSNNGILPGLSLPTAEDVAGSIPVSPSNNRDWAPQHARLPRIDLDGSRIVVHDVRNFDYVTENDPIERFETRAYDLRDLETVDYIVVPFAAAPLLAHTMLSFGFADGRYLISSVEVRLEKGEFYSPLLGSMRQFEIMYVMADERDAVGLRANNRGDDVFVYRVQTTPEKVRELFVDIADRVNHLYEQPEFYDTVTNNCTTNIARHVNRIAPSQIPYGAEVLLPGLSGQLAYNLGLLDRSVPFEELERRSNVSTLARLHRNSPDFSAKIRR